MFTSAPVLDIELPLVVRFAGKQMPLRELAGLGEGATVTFRRATGDPVELLVDDRVIARGEVLVSRGNYGIRITELVK
jgi:flagellar motor switch protein FliN/FliY